MLASSQASTQALSFYRVPLFLLPIYKAAAVQYGVPWQILAAVNEIETDYGADQSVSSAGAVGWMQFMPETWLMYGVDALEAGYADPYNPVDAVFAAARYLRAAGAATDLRRAILAYNHSEEYVDSVMLRAKLISTLSEAGHRHAHRPRGRAPAGRRKLAGMERSAHRSRIAARARRRTPRPPRPRRRQTPGSAVSPAAAAAARIAHAAPKLQVVDLTSAPGASVVAVQDGRVVQMGKSRRLGRYIVLRDVYGDLFTYAGLGSVAPSYTRAKPTARHAASPVVQVASTHDPAPSKAATAGSQAPVTLQVKAPAPQNHGSGGGARRARERRRRPGGMNRVRLFARPGNPDAQGGSGRADCAARRAREGRAAAAAAGRRGRAERDRARQGPTSHAGHAGHLRFAIRPGRRQRLHRPRARAGQLGAAAEGASPAGGERGERAARRHRERRVPALPCPARAHRPVGPRHHDLRLRAPGRRLGLDRPPRARGARVPLAQRAQADGRRAALRPEPVHRRGRALAALPR